MCVRVSFHLNVDVDVRFDWYIWYGSDTQHVSKTSGLGYASAGAITETAEISGEPPLPLL